MPTTPPKKKLIVNKLFKSYCKYNIVLTFFAIFALLSGSAIAKGKLKEKNNHLDVNEFLKDNPSIRLEQIGFKKSPKKPTKFIKWHLTPKHTKNTLRAFPNWNKRVQGKWISLPITWTKAPKGTRNQKKLLNHMQKMLTFGTHIYSFVAKEGGFLRVCLYKGKQNTQQLQNQASNLLASVKASFFQAPWKSPLFKKVAKKTWKGTRISKNVFEQQIFVAKKKKDLYSLVKYWNQELAKDGSYKRIAIKKHLEYNEKTDRWEPMWGTIALHHKKWALQGHLFEQVMMVQDHLGHPEILIQFKRSQILPNPTLRNYFLMGKRETLAWTFNKQILHLTKNTGRLPAGRLRLSFHQLKSTAERYQQAKALLFSILQSMQTTPLKLKTPFVRPQGGKASQLSCPALYQQRLAGKGKLFAPQEKLTPQQKREHFAYSTLLKLPVAKVNGEHIFWWQLMGKFANNPLNLPPAAWTSFNMRLRMLKSIIKAILLAQYAKKHKLQISQKELTKNIQSDDLAQYNKRFSKVLFHRLVHNVHMTNIKAYKKYLTTLLLADKARKKIEASTIISEADIQKSYRKKHHKRTLHFLRFASKKIVLPAQNTNPSDITAYISKHQHSLHRQRNNFSIYKRGSKKVRARHILFRTRGASQKQIADYRKKLDAIRNKVISGKVSFAAMAKKYSQGPSRTSGGDLGWFTKHVMTPSFSNAVFALKKKGEMTRVIHSPFGLHIAQLTGIKEPLPVPTIRQLAQKIVQKKRQRQYTQKLLKQLQRKWQTYPSTKAFLRDFAKRAGVTPHKSLLALKKSKENPPSSQPSSKQPWPPHLKALWRGLESKYGAASTKPFSRSSNYISKLHRRIEPPQEKTKSPLPNEPLGVNTYMVEFSGQMGTKLKEATWTNENKTDGKLYIAKIKPLMYFGFRPRILYRPAWFVSRVPEWKVLPPPQKLSHISPSQGFHSKLIKLTFTINSAHAFIKGTWKEQHKYFLFKLGKRIIPSKAHFLKKRKDIKRHLHDTRVAKSLRELLHRLQTKAKIEINTSLVPSGR